MSANGRRPRLLERFACWLGAHPSLGIVRQWNRYTWQLTCPRCQRSFAFDLADGLQPWGKVPGVSADVGGHADTQKAS